LIIFSWGILIIEGISWELCCYKDSARTIKGMSQQRNDGIDLEKKVASWAARRFGASRSVTRYLVNGLSVKWRYEVDVCIEIPGGLFGWFPTNIWIE
jgi:hypothetical protein